MLLLPVQDENILQRTHTYNRIRYRATIKSFEIYYQLRRSDIVITKCLQYYDYGNTGKKCVLSILNDTRHTDAACPTVQC